MELTVDRDKMDTLNKAKAAQLKELEQQYIDGVITEKQFENQVSELLEGGDQFLSYEDTSAEPEKWGFLDKYLWVILFAVGLLVLLLVFATKGKILLFLTPIIVLLWGARMFQKYARQ